MSRADVEAVDEELGAVNNDVLLLDVSAVADEELEDEADEEEELELPGGLGGVAARGDC